MRGSRHQRIGIGARIDRAILAQVSLEGMIGLFRRTWSAPRDSKGASECPRRMGGFRTRARSLQQMTQHQGLALANIYRCNSCKTEAKQVKYRRSLVEPLKAPSR